MKLDSKVEAMLGDYPKLKSWMEASGKSGELHHLPDSAQPTEVLLLYLSDEAAQQIDIVREGESCTRHASAAMETIQDIRGLVGTLRSFQINKSSENTIEIVLPMNTVQLHNIMAHPAVEAIGSLHKAHTRER